MKRSCRDRRPPYLLACVLLGIAGTSEATAAEPAHPGIPVLQASPPCVQDRLGLVSVRLGNKEANLRTGMPASAVSYQKAFAKLKDAAEAKGADAVVLRDHEAVYVAKGARRSKRPSYVSLRGAAIRLDASAARCDLVLIDPVEFERRALAQERQEAAKDAGLSF
ncbi:MAG TPA: hypothetical protein VGD21_00490 [Lysobacter sp.]